MEKRLNKMGRKYLLFIIIALLFSSFKTDKPVITIFMIGDSTMANKKLDGGNPERGWGHVLGGFFSEDIRIDNHAQNGRSSKTFIDEGRWDSVISQVKKGDYVFIQFGHNDEKPKEDRHTDPGTTFNANLARFVNETRAKGGIPVLFTSIIRRKFGDDGKLIDTHGDYPQATRDVAKQLNVTLIDMQKITHDFVENMGDEKSKELFMWVPANTLECCPDGKKDDTHLNVHGAKVVASLAVDALVKEIPALSEYVRHYDFVVAKDGSGDFFTVQEAINAIPDSTVSEPFKILIRKGIYNEKLTIPESKLNISLIGEKGASIR